MHTLPEKTQKRLESLGIVPEKTPETMTVEEKTGQFEQLPPDEQKYIIEYMAGWDAVGSAVRTWPDITRASAYHKGYQIRRKYEWLMQALIEANGVTPERVLRVHSELLKDKSSKIRLGAVELGYKINNMIGQQSNTRSANQVSQVVIHKDESKGIFSVGIKQSP